MSSHAEAFRPRLRLVEEVSSTNDEVKRALDSGEAEGLVVRALRQVAGYGRQGRAWTSPDGGLYCSLLLRPRVALCELSTLSLVVGMAVRRAIVALAGASAAEVVRIKWPNDVVVVDQSFLYERSAVQNRRYERFSKLDEKCDLVFCKSEVNETPKNRSYQRFCADNGFTDSASQRPTLSIAKLCGISLEAHGGGVCVGVGVNVLPPNERLDVGGKNRAAYVADLIADAPPSIEAVLDAFLEAFAPLYGEWARAGFAALVDEFNAHASLVGCMVNVVDRAGSAMAAGVVERIDVQGRLILLDASGLETPISSGEAHLV